MAKIKLTEERRKIILEAIGAGNTKETAAALAGISSSTLYNWLARGRDEEPPNLDNKTVKQLRTMAKQLNIVGRNKMNLPQLKDEITKASCIYGDFLEAMNLAEAKGIAQHVSNINAASLEDWKASAWYLERRDPDNWGRRDRMTADITHSGRIDTEQTINIAALSDEELTALEHLIEKAAQLEADQDGES